MHSRVHLTHVAIFHVKKWYASGISNLAVKAGPISRNYTENISEYLLFKVLP